MLTLGFPHGGPARLFLAFVCLGVAIFLVFLGFALYRWGKATGWREATEQQQRRQPPAPPVSPPPSANP